VAEFRRNKVITALNRHAWENRSDDFEVSDIDPKEVPIIKTVLANNDWDDVRRVYEDFEPGQWENPPSNTETAEVKARTIENMQELFDYSAASAELTSQHVMNQVSYKWD
jgi:predicted Ser/Thr protein kinase